VWREQIAISAQGGWGRGASPHLGIAGRKCGGGQIAISAQGGWGRGASPHLGIAGRKCGGSR
jgi:hypothetical protein